MNTTPYIRRGRTCAKIYEECYTSQGINFAKWRKITLCQKLGIVGAKIMNRYNNRVKQYLRLTQS